MASEMDDTSDARPCAEFPATKWSTYFLDYSEKQSGSDEWIQFSQQIEGLKEEVTRKLNVITEVPMRQLKMIDDIQQLGLGYHFEEEIDKALETMFARNMDICEHDLYHTSLYFRLMRQHGYNISADVFNKFIEPATGGLKENLLSDLLGLIGFYEAGQLRVHKDVLLDEALAKCVAHLASIAPNLNPKQSALLTNSLKQSIFKNIPRLQAKKYISTYLEDQSHDVTLLKLAKMDFNLLQNYHQQEISHISKWWKDLGLPSKCPFARERLVESYLWALATYFEPQYSLARSILAKMVSLLTFLDDIYDAYGKSEELELLTEAIRRWDTSLLDQMPAYMRAFYQALLDMYADFENEMATEGRSYRTHYIIDVMKNQAKAYHDEHLWLKNKVVPTVEEYMELGIGTSTAPCIVVSSLAGMGDIVTKEAFDWLQSNPKILVACSIIGRLRDDIASHKFEQKRRHAPSAVECYVKQHGVSELEAYNKLNKKVSDAWKDLNEGCLKPTPVPYHVLERMLNFARVSDVVYKEGDGFTHCKEFLDDKITALLVDPVPL